MRVFGRPGGSAFLVIMGLALGATGQATAARSGGSVEADGWQFEVVPYLWTCGLDGEVGMGELPAKGVEASFSDLVDVLDFALMTSFQARRDRGGFLVDAMYFDLGETAPTPDALFGDAEVDLVQQIYSAAGTWRLLEGKAPVTLFAGARYVDMETELALTSEIAAGRSVDSH